MQYYSTEQTLYNFVYYLNIYDCDFNWNSELVPLYELIPYNKVICSQIKNICTNIIFFSSLC